MWKIKVKIRENETSLSLIKRFNRTTGAKKRLYRRNEYFIKPSKWAAAK